MENKSEIAAALCKGICDCFGVTYAPPKATPDNAEIEALNAEIMCLQADNKSLTRDAIVFNAEVNRLSTEAEAREAWISETEDRFKQISQLCS